MEKSKQKFILLAVMGLVIVALLSAFGWVAFKMINRAGPKQIEQAREEERIKNRLPEQIKMDEMQEKYGIMLEEIESLPPFEPPEDGIITPERMRIYVDVHHATVEAIAEGKAAIPEGTKTVTEGILYATTLMLGVQTAHITKLLDHQMQEEEYSWIDNLNNEAKIIALLRLEELTDDPEVSAIMRGYAMRLAVTAGYSTTDESGEFIGQPEKLDSAKVPPQHYKYVLQYYKKLGMPFVEINELDWTPLLQAEGMPTE